MKQFINPEMDSILRRKTDDSHMIQQVLEEMWRGGKLLALHMMPDGKRPVVRLQGVECVTAFASQESAEAFGQMLIGRGAPGVLYETETLEKVLSEAEAEGRGLAVEAGTSRCMILPANILASIARLTRSLTGGRMPEEDLPLMRLHLGTVGNSERVKQAVNCGCFHCESIFPAAEVKGFMPEPDGSRTAVCPRCGCDTVLTDQDAEITARLLREMRARFFSEQSAEDAGLRLLYLERVRERIAEEKE